MSIRRRAIVGREPRTPVADNPDRVPEKNVEALTKEIEGLATTGAVDGASESRQDSKDSIAEEDSAEITDSGHGLASYIKKQIQSSPLTPAEIAERAGVSISQIYRFMKGERSLTLESADKILPVVGRSLVEAIRRQQGEMTFDGSVEDQIEDEKERLRRRLDKWERGTFQGVREILAGVGELADRIRKVIDEL